MTKIVLASNNKNKHKEFSELLKDSGLELVRADEKIEVNETGESFLENARLKAHAWSLKTGCKALADDSGILVRALSWLPGVRSARIVEGSDEDRNNWLLESLGESADRYAEYAASVVLCDAREGWTIETEARCGGEIATSPRGNNGFGYDPIFIPRGYSQTFGELSEDVKMKISHRALAVRHLLRKIQDLKNIVA